MTEQQTAVPQSIHATAIVHPEAHVPESTSVGPYSIIGPGVTIGERVTIGSHVLIERDTSVGDDTQVFKGAVLGTDPQDLKYAGEATTLAVGSRTTIREYATLNRGTIDSGTTVVAMARIRLMSCRLRSSFKNPSGNNRPSISRMRGL